MSSRSSRHFRGRGRRAAEPPALLRVESSAPLSALDSAPARRRRRNPPWSYASTPVLAVAGVEAAGRVVDAEEVGEREPASRGLFWSVHEAK